MARKTTILEYLIAAVLLLVVGFAVPLNNGKPLLSLGSALPTTSTGGSTSLSVASCNPLPKVSFSTQYYNQSANSGAGGWTQVASAYNITTPTYGAGQTALYSGTSSATAATNASVSCATSYTFVWGADANQGSGGVYVNSSTLSTSTAPLQTLTGVVKYISSPTITFKNATSAGYKATGGAVDNVNNNQVLSGGTYISILVAAGQQSFGNPNYAMQFAYNSAIVTSISIPGYSQVSQTLPSETGAPAGSSFVAFTVPGVSNYQTEVINPTFQLGTIHTGAANTLDTTRAVSVFLVPQTNYFYQGQVLTGLYVKPGTTTAIGGVITAANAIAFGTT